MTEPRKISNAAFEACQNSDNTLYLSVASVWEMQIKSQRGKLDLQLPLAQIIREQTAGEKFILLPIQVNHVLALAELPLHHNDPFDRLLIAQTKSENAQLVSIDAKFKNYSVDVIW